ncbi:hypothetical protein Pyn_09197 [Prunus yedoensis var. nudiflora]|uniref:Uncharacterized protein n=1 Tax=Prunus yedoensis var. nudiflora TaxID=2094558 RepID=A0A314XYT1_PRUYE|nr:hypothetical protein Pyn_09197 [Prunus yedoensis var. nudiflora]
MKIWVAGKKMWFEQCNSVLCLTSWVFLLPEADDVPNSNASVVDKAFPSSRLENWLQVSAAPTN